MFLCHPLPIVDRIFFRCFGMSCFFSVLFYPLSISLWFPFHRQHFLFFFSSSLLLFILVLPPVFFYYSGLFSYLFNLSSLASTFCFFLPQVVLLFFLVLPVPFCSRLFQRLSFFIILVCLFRFFICVSSRISHPGFDCLFVLFGGDPNFLPN